MDSVLPVQVSDSVLTGIGIGPLKNIDIGLFSGIGASLLVQELAIKKRHQAYRIAAIVHIARLKPKS